MGTGSLRYTISNGYLWSSSTYESLLHGYYLSLNNLNVVPANNAGRWNGFMVRVNKTDIVWTVKPVQRLIAVDA